MKFSTKILLDRLAGKMLCLALIPIVRIVGLILRRDHSMAKDNVSCIVVAKYFGLGSITHAMPMLKALKEKYPNARLLFLTRKNNSAIIQHIKYIDEGIYIDDRSLRRLVVSNIKIFYYLASCKVDLFFDLEVFSAYGALVSLFSLARNRLGFFSTQNTDFKAWIYTHLMYFNFQMPVRLCYMQLARLAGVPPDASIDLLPYDISEEIRLAANEKIKKMLEHSSKGILAVNVNASELSYSRRWPLVRFAKVISHFTERGHSIILLGSPSERDYIQGVFGLIEDAKLHANIHNTAGVFSFSEMLAILQERLVLLTNDTGILNFAYAQGTSSIALFGPNTPKAYHVYNKKHKLIFKNFFCSPCIHQFLVSPCGEKADCMTGISTNEVIEATENMLLNLTNKITAVKTTPEKYSVISEDNQYVYGTLRLRR